MSKFSRDDLLDKLTENLEKRTSLLTEMINEGFPPVAGPKWDRMMALIEEFESYHKQIEFIDLFQKDEIWVQ